MSTSSTGPADRSPFPPPVLAPTTPNEPADATPPPPAGAPHARPGDLTPSWRFLLGAAWALAFFAYAAIWNASVQIGIGTWWIGPRGNPPVIVARLLPFLLCLAVLMCIIYNVGNVVRISAIATGLAAVGAIPDFSRSVGLGAAEMVVAGLLAIVTLTALTGRYRIGPADPVGTPSAEPGIDLPPPPD